MAYSSIVKPSVYFNTKLYTGNGGTNAITGVGHQPDLVWLKERSSAGAGLLFDAVRTATKFVRSSDSASEVTAADTLTAFNSDGFTLGADAGNYAANQNSETYASWNWKANGQGSSNTDGTINSTYTSANTTSGFSIVKYTGNGSANATVGHGLGVEPSMIIFKCLTHQQSWITYNKSLGTGYYLYLNSSDASSSASGAWCTPSASTFQLNQVFNATNTSGRDYIAYCFAEKTGYSKFGSYVGNNNAEGPFVYTGFKPAFVIVKPTSGTEHWTMYDNKRIGYNPTNYQLYPNLDSSEATISELDVVSNGFKIRSQTGRLNNDGVTMIYMAFAEEPLVANVGAGIPATAR